MLVSIGYIAATEETKSMYRVSILHTYEKKNVFLLAKLSREYTSNIKYDSFQCEGWL